MCPLTPQINSSKKKVGVISPKKFVQRLKRDNELFRGHMHQVPYGVGPVGWAVGGGRWGDGRWLVVVGRGGAVGRWWAWRGEGRAMCVRYVHQGSMQDPSGGCEGTPDHASAGHHSWCCSSEFLLVPVPLLLLLPSDWPQDAHEFLNYLLNCSCELLEQEAKAAGGGGGGGGGSSQPITTWVHDIFQVGRCGRAAACAVWCREAQLCVCVYRWRHMQ